ncbi:MAG: efflux RND transporter permease subunit [Elusimicrobia bacterium]|nr:efflux RND transporter permease subunit [Elusimicrobiota bacterium]
MVNKIIEWCLKNRFLVILLFILLIFWGYRSMRNTPVDAIPDIGELQVIIYAEWPGRSPVDMEEQVIYPATTRLMGTPKIKVVRSLSAFGWGLIYVIFEEDADYYWARTRVLERLPLAQQVVPKNVVLTLGPDATALGQVFWYTVENGYYCTDHPQKSYEKPGKCPVDGKDLVLSKYDLGKLRSVQDWYIRYQLNSVSGVSEVASVGGFVKQYQVDVDPNKLVSYKIPISKVIQSVKKGNIDVGAKVFEENTAGVEFLIRSKGFIKKEEDIENIVVGGHQGTPVYIKNVANVTVGGDFRRGALDKQGREVTGGVVLMRYGENPLTVINRVKNKIEELEPGLPPGIRIVSFYDRTALIKRTIKTLWSALTQEIIITVFVVAVFLLHFFGSLIISIVLPIGILIAFLIMYYLNIDANMMSLGGIAIAIGVMVDSGCVMVENIYNRLAEAVSSRGERLTSEERLGICTSASKEVGSAVFTALMTTIVGFIPVFVLSGEAGKLFKPLAYTKTFVMVAAAFIAVMLLPTLAYYLLRGKLKLSEENTISKGLRKIYTPVIRWAVEHKKIIIGSAFILLLLGIILLPRIKREFMPPLNEGDMLFMPVLLPGASLTQVMDVMKKQDIIIKNEFPEVEWIVGKLGRAETATDPAPVPMIESIIHLKPKKYWRKGMGKDELIREIIDKTKIPGVSPIMTQPIRNRIDMLATGIQTPVGIKVLGPDLDVLENLVIQLEKIVQKEVKGTTSAFAERTGQRPYFEIEIMREEIARYGLQIEDIQDIVMTAIGGMNLTETVEGRERYPVRVRYLRELRDNPEALKRIFVPTPSGAHIPLSQLAKLKKVRGPAVVNSENTMPYKRVFINVDPKIIGLVDYVNLAKKVIKEKISSGELVIPQGYFISWSGQYISEMEARKKLQVAVPVALLIVLIILYINFKSFLSVAVTATGLPISLMGGVIFLYFFKYNMSVAVWVGFIALFGVATDNAVVLVTYLDDLFRRRKIETVRQVRETVIEGGLHRIRPAMMTTVTTILALIPIMLATGSGSEVMKPMAAPIFYGLAVVTLTNLIFVPVLYCLLKEINLKRRVK